jgi:DNA-binding NarL/FixJ family response regulator
MIRIFYIEDHPATVAGLKTYCRPERDQVTIAESASTIEEALLIQANSFDLIFLDLWLPGIDHDPIANIEKLSKNFPGKPIIMYTGEDGIYWQKKAFALGVKGFLEKNATRPLILETVKRVMLGEVVYTPKMMNFQAKRQITAYKAPQYGLTEDEKLIVNYFLEGMPPKVIAEKIDKNISTVNRHFKTIRGKFKKYKVYNNYDLMITILTLKE